MAKLYVGGPPGGLAPPPTGNPGSASGLVDIYEERDILYVRYEIKEKLEEEEEVRMDSSSFALAKINTLIDCTSE